MRVNDAVSGVVIMLLSIVLFVHTLSFPDVPGFQYGAGVFPRAVLTVLFGCGAWLTVKGLAALKVSRLVEAEPWARKPRGWIMLGLIVAGMLLYILASESLGFVPVCAVIIFTLLAASRGRRHVLSSAVLAVAFPLALEFVFVNALRVPLPAGLLSGWL